LPGGFLCCLCGGYLGVYLIGVSRPIDDGCAQQAHHNSVLSLTRLSALSLSRSGSVSYADLIARVTFQTSGLPASAARLTRRAARRIGGPDPTACSRRARAPCCRPLSGIAPKAALGALSPGEHAERVVGRGRSERAEQLARRSD